MTIFRCTACDTALTPDLTQLPSVPDVSATERIRDQATRRAASTVPLGSFAVDPEPFGPPFEVHDDEAEEPQRAQGRAALVFVEEGFLVSAGPRGTVLVHPDDVVGLAQVEMADWSLSTACCGPTGRDGFNRACPCGAEVGTLVADCIGPYELHLDPSRVYAGGGR